MSLNKFWDEYELFFYFEFINMPNFQESKRVLLKNEMGSYFINRDFTIYQMKAEPFDIITELDFRNNRDTFMRILYSIHLSKVYDFIEFHYDKYGRDKRTWLTYVYNEFKGSKTTKGGIEQQPIQSELMLLEWCEKKINELDPKIINKKNVHGKKFIHKERIEELNEIKDSKFDLGKLIKMLTEINDNYSLGNFYSVAMLGRSVINHIPPIFGFEKFSEVSNNYGNSSFKKSMSHLNTSMRSIADNYLHTTVRKKESLPNENQIDFSQDFDVLLGEIVIKLTE